jgi:hypothetical protein
VGVPEHCALPSNAWVSHMVEWTSMVRKPPSGPRSCFPRSFPSPSRPTLSRLRAPAGRRCAGMWRASRCHPWASERLPRQHPALPCRLTRPFRPQRPRRWVVKRELRGISTERGCAKLGPGLEVSTRQRCGVAQASGFRSPPLFAPLQERLDSRPGSEQRALERHPNASGITRRAW